MLATMLEKGVGVVKALVVGPLKKLFLSASLSKPFHNLIHFSIGRWTGAELDDSKDDFVVYRRTRHQLC